MRGPLSRLPAGYKYPTRAINDYERKMPSGAQRLRIRNTSKCASNHTRSGPVAVPAVHCKDTLNLRPSLCFPVEARTTVD